MDPLDASGPRVISKGLDQAARTSHAEPGVEKLWDEPAADVARGAGDQTQVPGRRSQLESAHADDSPRADAASLRLYGRPAAADVAGLRV